MGNLSTYFDGSTANGNWVGLDLGSSKSISEFTFAPRSGYASRMVGGEFQVSTTANFSSGVTTVLHHQVNTYSGKPNHRYLIQCRNRSVRPIPVTQWQLWRCCRGERIKLIWQGKLS